MAELVAQGSELVVRMSALDRLAAMRGDVRVPLSAVRSVALVSGPWSALVELDRPSEFGRLVVSVSDGDATVAAVRSASEARPLT